MRGLDVRARLAAFVCLAGIIILTRSWAEALGVVLAVIALGLILGAKRAFSGALKGLLPMVLIVMVISFVFFGWQEGLTAGLRFAGLLALGVIFFATSDASELGRGLMRLRVPYPAVFVVLTGLNYVPLINRRLGEVADAQRARGIAVGLKPSELRNLPALLVPALIHCFLLADDLAMAMEARGFSRPERRVLPPKRLSVLDWMVVALFCALLVLKAVL